MCDVRIKSGELSNKCFHKDCRVDMLSRVCGWLERKRRTKELYESNNNKKIYIPQGPSQGKMQKKYVFDEIVYEAQNKSSEKRTLHKKWSFPLRISSITVSCGSGHIYWRILDGKLYFLCSGNLNLRSREKNIVWR